MDNEPRNAAIVFIVEQLAKNNKRVCIWSRDNKYKDINEMILNGIDVHGMILKNTQRGLSALVEFNNWRKINVK